MSDAGKSLAERARELWTRLSSRAAQPAAAPAEAVAATEVRVKVLEARVVALGEEALSSFDVVRSIAEQHSQLAEGQAVLAREVEALRGRVGMLLGACVALALVVACLALALVVG